MRPAAALTLIGGRTFTSLLKYPSFRLFFASHAVSFTGTWMQQIAAYWLVLDLTGSPVAVGGLALAQLLPVTLLGLFVGSLVDRFDVRRILVATQTVMTVIATTLAVLTLSGVIEVWHVYVLGFLHGTAAVLDNPSRHTLVFRIVGEHDLPNAVALSSSLGTMARIFGPAIGGIVVALVGSGVAFGINAASYLVVIAALLAMRIPTRGTELSDVARVGLLIGARDAVAFAFGSTRTAVTFLSVLIVSTLSFNFDVLLPLLAKRTLHEEADVFGLIAATFGAGALCGALLLATIGKARLLILLLGAGGFGGFELVLARQTSLAPICALLFTIGVFYVLWGSSALATLQLSAPEHLRGRAASLYFFGFQGGAPVGGLLAGWLTSAGGTELAFTVGGAVAVGVAVAGALAVRLAPAPLPAP